MNGIQLVSYQTLSTANVVWHQVIVWEGDVKNELGDTNIDYLK